MEKELELTNDRLTKLETQKMILKGNLEENLKLKRYELELAIQDRQQGHCKANLEETKHSLMTMKTEINLAQEEEQRVNLVIDEITKKLRIARTDLDAFLKDDAESTARIESEDCSLEKLALEKSRLLNKKENTQKKIREIGSIPDDALGKYEDHSKRVRLTLLSMKSNVGLFRNCTRF